MDALTALVARYPACAEHNATRGASSLRVGEHLCTMLPPEELITTLALVQPSESVRGVAVCLVPMRQARNSLRIFGKLY